MPEHVLVERGCALDKLSGFLITPATAVLTSQILANKKPIIGPKEAEVSCSDHENLRIYLWQCLIFNQCHTDPKISPLNFNFPLPMAAKM